MRHRRSSLFRLRTIRGQLARLVLVAILVDLSLLTVTVINALVAHGQASDTSTAVNLEVADQAFIHELQKERGLTVGLLGGGEQFRMQLPAQRARTDAALAALKKLMADPSYAAPAAQLRPALQRLDALAGVRDAADHAQIDRNSAFKYFTDTNLAFNAPDLGFDQASDASLRYSLLALRTLGDAKEPTGEERALLNGVFAAGHFEGQQFVQFTEIRANKLAALADFGHYADPTQHTRLDVALHSPVADHVAEMENVALGGANGRLPRPVNASDWYTSMTNYIDKLRTVQLSIGDDALARTHELEENATWELLGALALAVLTVGAEVVLVISAARSIIKPLEELAADADDMATLRLPEAVARLERSSEEVPAAPRSMQPPARASSEIQLVAEAFDRVQHTAFTLASKQALIRRNTTDSLANLGRRNQNLVRRQLSLISKFEHDELDPAALANLFDLDHLATRMRRNAESLLVLVGESNPRRWSQPLPIADVLRAAMSEVEDYRRVTLRRVDDAHIAGAIAAEVAHLLAELIENGLSFSPPDVDVEIYGRHSGSRYVIAVVDQGLGMSDEEIARANARLCGEEHFLVAPTRFLGHYVVGGLARSLDARVELARSPLQGITAQVMLPDNLLVNPKPMPGAPTQVPGVVNGAPITRKSLPARETTARPPEPAVRPRPASTARCRADPDVTMSGKLDAPQPVAAPLVPAAGSSTNGSTHTRNGPPQAPAAEPSTNGSTRTRNGLVKRVRKQPTSNGHAATPPSAERPASQSSSERSPEEVRTMLSAFRAGHCRGEQQPTAQAAPASVSEENHR
ncbi:MAG TPA: nitrate- and nitrite sensing domain-containing protein [Pseudonocardiaceae bacterium]|nr:nitrate- and nitrite sensing domain-containing protein [Pseudonocardiaceae bacterium]